MFLYLLSWRNHASASLRLRQIRFGLPPLTEDRLLIGAADAQLRLEDPDLILRFAMSLAFFLLVDQEERHDAGDKLGFLKATVEFALKREDLGGEFREYLKTLQL